MELALSFNGNLADEHQLDFYDASQALAGFQRTLALTTHLVLNGKVITQAPSLQNAQILIYPPSEGSWKLNAKVAITAATLTGIYQLGTAPKDTPLGHLMYSAYDYVISESVGFHVDYEKTLGESYDEMKSNERQQLPILEQSQFDSIIEKCENSIKQMHRPISASESAEAAEISWIRQSITKRFSTRLDKKSYEYIAVTHQSDRPERLVGKVSSFNINTNNGRIFIPDLRRPIAFTLSESARNFTINEKILQNLNLNSRERFGKGSNGGLITLVGYRNTSSNGRLKSFRVVDVQ